MDYLSDQEAVDVVAACLRRGEGEGEGERGRAAAEELVARALAKAAAEEGLAVAELLALKPGRCVAARLCPSRGRAVSVSRSFCFLSLSLLLTLSSLFAQGPTKQARRHHSCRYVLVGWFMFVG